MIDLYEGNNIIPTFQKREMRLRGVKQLAQSHRAGPLLFPLLHTISKASPKFHRVFHMLFLRIMYQVYGSFYSFLCRKTRAITTFKGTKHSTYTPPACVPIFCRNKCKCVLFSECCVKERKKAALPGMWTILSDALMSLAEPKAFKGRCTLPSLVNHRLPKAEEFQAKEKAPLSGTVTGP